MHILFRLFACLITVFYSFEVAASQATPHDTYNCAPATTDRTKPLYITPHIQMESKEDIPLLLEKFEEMEPGGARGKVRMGYMKGIFPLGLYEKKNGKWVFDDKKLEKELKQALRIQRPFVLYVFSNHFLPSKPFPLVRELLDDPDNLMQYRDGAHPQESYFGTEVIPFRLTNDPEEPLRHYLDEALQRIAERMKAFDNEHPGMLVGTALNGETHYLYERFHDGTGNFTSPRLTDYHPKEIAAFQSYLQKHSLPYKAETISSLPMNRYEWGIIPFSGWVYPLNPGDKVEIWLNGNKTGEAVTGINRMDVYRDRHGKNPHFSEPNSGFVYPLDYRSLPAGKHYVEALLVKEGERYLIGSRWLQITGKNEDISHFGEAPARKPIPVTKGDGYLDQPANGSKLHYEPPAEHWMAFRAENIRRYVEKMAQPFLNAGFSKDRVFSYQLTPWLIGNWNDVLFGVHPDFFASGVMSPGVTVYGGNMNNPHIFDLVKGRPYGIPEFHPQGITSKPWMTAALNKHYCNGAAFLSPYFIIIHHQKGRNIGQPLVYKNEHNIQKDNPLWSSDVFYDSLVEFLIY